MIDLKALRKTPELYKNSAKARGISVDIDSILKLDKQRLDLLREVEGLRSQLNVGGKPSDKELDRLQQAKTKLTSHENELKGLESQLAQQLELIPNLLADGTPEGGEEGNREEKTWGAAEAREGLDHMSLAEQNGWLDFERGAKVSGNKFYYLLGGAVKLEMAVMRLAFDLLEKSGFTAMSTPHLVTKRILDGTGFAPKGEEDQVYNIEGENLALIGTAEIPLTGFHADEIIDAGLLPLQYMALTPSYRKEAGAYGRHSRGLYRVHQFNKLEMYILCRPEDSEAWQQKLLEYEEKLCRIMDIPYRVVRIAAGDLGAPAYKKYDLEYWSPVDKQYRELTSCSNCTDYQSRRLNIRLRGQDGTTQYVHTLNGTAIAFSRLFIALVENHQQPDGSVRLPSALAQIYGGDKL
jgi:seryl-tRNA synthetase